ncbi:hypothetical protein BCR44DRAFT_1139070 [Catenaria anguillulae PL171]|uniref:Uncharacterized protein n=1 Tax=Catenaria anguillulae PL171 TaxID=765915 RepID=A0A1Y2HK47_9FUNG|nr:hypothetical protein BCR44DRAFT_1139070 [Catenaria anguillulae PL171]
MSRKPPLCKSQRLEYALAAGLLCRISFHNSSLTPNASVTSKFQPLLLQSLHDHPCDASEPSQVYLRPLHPPNTSSTPTHFRRPHIKCAPCRARHCLGHGHGAKLAREVYLHRHSNTKGKRKLPRQSSRRRSVVGLGDANHTDCIQPSSTPASRGFPQPLVQVIERIVFGPSSSLPCSLLLAIGHHPFCCFLLHII